MLGTSLDHLLLPIAFMFTHVLQKGVAEALSLGREIRCHGADPTSVQVCWLIGRSSSLISANVALELHDKVLDGATLATLIGIDFAEPTVIYLL